MKISTYNPTINMEKEWKIIFLSKNATELESKVNEYLDHLAHPILKAIAMVNLMRCLSDLAEAFVEMGNRDFWIRINQFLLVLDKSWLKIETSIHAETNSSHDLFISERDLFLSRYTEYKLDFV
ncbi:MAG: hypothetical protein AAF696_02795 [Bacteroidota bacterium]